MGKKYIHFTNKKTGKLLVKISVEGSTKEEIEPTRGLLAYENNLDESDIEVEIK